VLHTTQMDGDVMKMEAAGAVEILPGGTLEMKPGGSHVMMMGLSAPLKQGGTIELTLSFETAGELKVMVPVGGIAAGSP
jgi:periplasmic copper chaperone A